MRKNIFLFLVCLFLLIPFKVSATVDVHFFHRVGCSNCEGMINCLDNIKIKYDINVIYYDISIRENEDFMNLVKHKISEKTLTGVPFIVVKDKYFRGYSNSICERLEDYIIYASSNDLPDYISMIKNNQEVEKEPLNDYNHLLNEDTSEYSDSNNYLFILSLVLTCFLFIIGLIFLIKKYIV